MQFSSKLENIIESPGDAEMGVDDGVDSVAHADHATEEAQVAQDLESATAVTAAPIALAAHASQSIRSPTPQKSLSTSLNGHSSADKETADYLRRQITMLSTRNRELSLAKQDLQIRLDKAHHTHAEALEMEQAARQQEADVMVAHMTKQKELHKSTLSKWKEELARQTANREEIERRYLASEEELEQAFAEIDAHKERTDKLQTEFQKCNKELDKCKSDLRALSEKRRRDADAYEETIATLKHDSGNKKDADRRMHRLQAKIDALTAENNDLQDKVEASKDDQAELDQADETIKELRRSLEKAQKEGKSSKTERSLERKLKTAESEVESLQSELKSVERSVEKRVKKQLEEFSEGEIKVSEGVVCGRVTDAALQSLQKQLNKQKEKATIILADLKESERNRLQIEKELKQWQDSADLADEHIERAEKAEKRIKKLESTINDLQREQEMMQDREEETKKKDKGRADKSKAKSKVSKKPSYSALSDDEEEPEEDEINVRKSRPQPKPRKRKAEVEMSDDEDAPAPKTKRANTKDDKKAKKKINIFGNGPAQPQRGIDGGVPGLPSVLSPVKTKSKTSAASKGSGRGPFG
ncbi:hypothetical protein E3P99_01573 [Wallemia hederae]|uniref:Uncharacterized protein n=1 Tax=Wallemia hederae TaxID=1540922 RepID=A0A4T0FS11_9BASI|nr:hypothetical protein E3P99_01573 [Wallemia hederae]